MPSNVLVAIYRDPSVTRRTCLSKGRTWDCGIPLCPVHVTAPTPSRLAQLSLTLAKPYCPSTRFNSVYDDSACSSRSCPAQPLTNNGDGARAGTKTPAASMIRPISTQTLVAAYSSRVDFDSILPQAMRAGEMAGQHIARQERRIQKKHRCQHHETWLR